MELSANQIMNESRYQRYLRCKNYPDDQRFDNHHDILNTQSISVIPKYHILHMLVNKCYNFLIDKQQQTEHEKMALLLSSKLPSKRKLFIHKITKVFDRNNVDWSDFKVESYQNLPLFDENSVKCYSSEAVFDKILLIIPRKYDEKLISIKIDQGFFIGWYLVIQIYSVRRGALSHYYFDVILTQAELAAKLSNFNKINQWYHFCYYDLTGNTETSSCTCHKHFNHRQRTCCTIC